MSERFFPAFFLQKTRVFRVFDRARSPHAPLLTVSPTPYGARIDFSRRSRGSAFVAFSSADEATRAVTEMNGKMAGNKPLYVALAQRKEDRRARLQAQFAQRAVAAGGMPNMGPYGMAPPGAPMYYGQPPPGVMGPPQPQPGFGMPMMPPGGPGRGPMGPGGPGMQYVMPMPQRQGMPGQRGRGGRGGQGGGRGQGRQNMRFPVQNQPPAPLPGGAPPQAEEANPVAVLAQQLPSATPDQARMLLGEALYPLVEEIEPASAAKITGMLLEMDQGEVLLLIEDSGALRAKVQEALAVLKAAAAEEGN